MIYGPEFDQAPSDRQWLNTGLVFASAAFGLAGLLFPSQSKGLFTTAGIFYGLQLIESLTSETWGYLCNVKSK